MGNNPVIRKQDAAFVFVYVAMTDVGFYVAKDFLYNRIAEISER